MTDSDRMGQLDSTLDGIARPGDALADELFSFVDALDSTPTLRRVLTDPSTPVDSRVALVRNLFASSASDGATQVVTEAVSLKWSGGRHLADAIERQAVRAELKRAGDGVDEIEDEMFRLGRLVDATPGLRSALSDQARSRSDRQDLVSDVLTGHATDTTTKLARRAVAGRSRTFTATMDSYVDVAAQLRNQVVATVRVAREIEPEQLARLKAALTSQVGRDVSIQQIIDPEILGGVRVELGDEVVEGTVAGRLSEARRHFSGS